MPIWAKLKQTVAAKTYYWRRLAEKFNLLLIRRVGSLPTQCPLHFRVDPSRSRPTGGCQGPNAISPHGQKPLSEMWDGVNSSTDQNSSPPVFPPYLRSGSDGQMARWGASHIHYPLCPLNATSRASRAKLGKLINASAFVLARLAALNLMPVFDAEFTAASALLGLVGGRGQPASEPCLLRCNLSFICLFTLAPEQIEIKSTAATMPPTIPIAR